MSSGTRDVDLLNGGLFKPLVVLAVPIVLSQAMQVVYNLVNTFWVGHIGPDAVSAVSFSFPIIFLVISVTSGFAIAGTTLVSQNTGAGKHDAADHVAGQTITFAVGASIIVGTIGYFLAPWLITLIGAPVGSQIHQWAVQYTRVIFVSIFVMFGFFMFRALLRGVGDTKTPMYLTALSIVINIVIDPFLIYGFDNNLLLSILGLHGLATSLLSATGFTGYGVVGGAIGQVIARGIVAIIGMAILFSGRVGIQLSWTDFRPDRETIRQVIEIGLPASLDTSMRAVGIVGLTIIVALAGTDTVAAYGIGNRINTLVILPAMGFARATATVVGQNLGARQIDRAKRAVYLSVLTLSGVLVAFSVVAYVYAQPIIAVFLTSGGVKTASVVGIGVGFLHVIAPSFLFIGVFQVILSSFRGSGNTRTSMMFSILSLLVLRLPIAYVLSQPFGFGSNGIWMGIAASNVIASIAAALWFLRGTWTESVVEPEESQVGPQPVTQHAGEK